MVETWAEADLNEYDKRYSAGSEETEKRLRTCAICGCDFDLSEGKIIDICRASKIRIDGERPEYIYICDCCYGGADEIESEDEYEI